MNKTITNIINNVVDLQREEQIKAVETCLNVLFSHVQTGYIQSRECVQHALNQFYRVSDAAQICMFSLIKDKLCKLSVRFDKTPSKSLDYIKKIQDFDIETIIQKVMPLLSGKQVASELNMRIADCLSYEERRFFSNFVVNSISYSGLQTEWKKETIDNYFLFFIILYPIAVKDEVMDIFFNSYYNFLDRVSTSGYNQEARDFAENLLIIGYDQGMLADAYYGASRTYTAARNVIGGLFYMNIALYCLDNSLSEIPQRLAFEMLWQYLKIMRLSSFVNIDSIDEMISLYNRLDCNEYDMLSINHTALSIVLMSGDKSFKDRTVDFLNKNREAFFSNLEHSAMPWLSLIKSYRNLYPEKVSDELSMYEAAVMSAVKNDGNEKFFHLMVGGENLEKHLKEELVKLQSTRNIGDFAHDNYIALNLAKKLLTKAVKENLPESFILAMLPKSDFTFVMEEKSVMGNYVQLEIEEVDGDNCYLPYGDMNKLPELVGADKNDIIVWIGKGTDSFYLMKLIRGCYAFDNLDHLNKININDLQQNVISQQYFQKTCKPANGPIYIKSNDELELENDAIKSAMCDVMFEMPNIASRCLISKDIEVAGIPHQLIMDGRTGCFIGEMLPTCNIISTELLIKSNFEDQLPDNFTKSFWLPIESKEFTFEDIKGRLADVLNENSFTISECLRPENPLNADLNIFCAHGGKDIGKTYWFYANETPIVETQRIVGKGRILVLFVCHSGSMLRSNVDNAIHTIVKRYLRMGYSAVVAPMWSLATEILPCWLSAFMAGINNHEYVIDAVYKANMAVKKEYVSVSAWGCMHLFGNPYVQINDKPRLQIEENLCNL